MKDLFRRLFGVLVGGERPPLERFYGLFVLVIAAYFLADLSALYTRSMMLPSAPPSQKKSVRTSLAKRTYNFSNILTRNIFNSDGKVPPTLSEIQGGPKGFDGDPVLSKLPLTLVGTIVHANPDRSIATVLMKGKNQVESVAVGDEIPSLLEVRKIEREKMVFINKKNQNLEYIIVPQDEKIVISAGRPKPSQSKPAGKTKFNFSRDEVNKQLEDLPKLLQQARAIPEKDANGQTRCFKLVDIKSGSIYEQIGLQRGDCILRVNSEDVKSPQKAMQMYQALKSDSEISITVDRGGSEVDLNYTIN